MKWNPNSGIQKTAYCECVMDIENMAFSSCEYGWGYTQYVDYTYFISYQVKPEFTELILGKKKQTTWFK